LLHGFFDRNLLEISVQGFFVEHFGKIVEQKAWLQRSFVESLA
jgi:hypothetical protein